MLRIPLIILASILFLLFFTMFCKSDLPMAVFPFYAEIWGTVSDWIMVAVTALTAFFLWRTLRSQQIVQSAQTELTQLEIARYRESILPKWKLTVNTRMDEQDDEITQDLNLPFFIALVQSQAYNITLNATTRGINLITPIPITKLFFNTNQKLIVFGFYNGFVPDRFEIRIEASIKFVIKYSDRLGNIYSQDMSYSLFENGDVSFDTAEPILQ